MFHMAEKMSSSDYMVVRDKRLALPEGFGENASGSRPSFEAVKLRGQAR